MSSSNSTSSSTFYGCWGNSNTAVSTCCTLLGGLSSTLPDGTTPACAYNSGARFVADDPSASGNDTTSARWASCVASHFNATSDGSVVQTACENSQDLAASVTSTIAPSATATGHSGARRTSGLGLGRLVLAGVVGSGLAHLLASSF